MSLTEKGFDEQFMMGLYGKEGTYDTPVTMSAANAFSLGSFNPIGVDYPDTITSDKKNVTGSQFGTKQEKTENAVTLTVGEAETTPNTVAGLAALVLGDITSLKDSTDDAYAHTIIPVAVGTALSSITCEHKKGRIQTQYSGVKGNSLKIAGEAGGYLSCEAELMGSGTRPSSAAAFAATVTESWMAMKNGLVWKESDALAAYPTDITITAIPLQGAEDISSGTPDDLKVRIKSFEYNYSNNLELQVGMGGAGSAHDIDKGQATMSLIFTLNFLNATAAAEFLHYENQDVMAFEIDVKGAQIDTSASAGIPLYYGMHLIIARGQLMKHVLPQGGPSDILTQEWELDIQDDGTEPAARIIVYNAVSDYLSAAA